MIELQKLVDRIEEEFGLEFQQEENFYYIKEGSSIIIDLFNIDMYGCEVDVTVRLTSELEVEIHHVLFYDRQINEFIYNLKKVVSAVM